MKNDLTLDGGERWFAVQSLPHRETGARLQLENQGYRVFLPRIRNTRRHARKTETVLAPFFPRYLFVILDMDRDQWRSVNGTFGVARLVMQNGRPLPVPPGIAESFIDLADEDGILRFDANDGLKVGQKVEIVSGPFARQIGQIVRFDSKMRINVLLSVLSRKVGVQMPGIDVRPTAA